MAIKFLRPFSRRQTSDTLPPSASTPNLQDGLPQQSSFEVIPRNDNTLLDRHQQNQQDRPNLDGRRQWSFGPKMAPGLSSSLQGASHSTGSSTTGPINDSSASSARFSSSSTSPPLGTRQDVKSSQTPLPPPRSFTANNAHSRPQTSSKGPPSRSSDTAGSSRFSLRTFTLRGGHPGASLFSALKPKKLEQSQPDRPELEDSESVSSDDEILAHKQQKLSGMVDGPDRPTTTGANPVLQQRSLLGSKISLGDSFGDMFDSNVENQNSRSRASVYGVPPPSAVSPGANTWLSPSTDRPSSQSSQFSFDARRGDFDATVLTLSGSAKAKNMAKITSLGSPPVPSLQAYPPVAARSAQPARMNQQRDDEDDEDDTTEDDNIFEHLQPKKVVAKNPYAPKLAPSHPTGLVDPSFASLITSYSPSTFAPSLTVTPVHDPVTKVMTPAQFNESRRKMEQEALEKTRQKNQRHLLRAGDQDDESEDDSDEDDDRNDSRERIQREKSVRRKRNEHLAFRQSMVKSTQNVAPLADINTKKQSMSTPDLLRQSTLGYMPPSMYGGSNVDDDDDDVPLNVLGSQAAQRARMSGRTSTMSGVYPSMQFNMGMGAAAAAGFGSDLPMRPSSASGLGGGGIRHSGMPVFARNLPADLPNSMGVHAGSSLVNIIQSEEIARNARRGSHIGNSHLGLGGGLPAGASMQPGMHMQQMGMPQMGMQQMGVQQMSAGAGGQGQYLDIINRQNEMMNAMQAQILALQQTVTGAPAPAYPMRPQSTVSAAFGGHSSMLNLPTQMQSQRAMSMISPAPGWSDMEIPVGNRAGYATSLAGSEHSNGTSARYRRGSSITPVPQVTPAGRRSMLGQPVPFSPDNSGQELFNRLPSALGGSGNTLAPSGAQNQIRRPISMVTAPNLGNHSAGPLSSGHASANTSSSSSAISVSNAGKRGSSTTVEVVPEEAETAGEDEEEAWAAVRRRKQQQQQRKPYAAPPVASGLNSRNPNSSAGHGLYAPNRGNGSSNRLSMIDSSSENASPGGDRTKVGGLSNALRTSPLLSSLPTLSVTPPAVPVHAPAPVVSEGGSNDHVLDDDIKGMWRAGMRAL